MTHELYELCAQYVQLIKHFISVDGDELRKKDDLQVKFCAKEIINWLGELFVKWDLKYDKAKIDEMMRLIDKEYQLNAEMDRSVYVKIDVEKELLGEVEKSLTASLPLSSSSSSTHFSSGRNPSNSNSNSNSGMNSGSSNNGVFPSTDNDVDYNEIYIDPFSFSQRFSSSSTTTSLSTFSRSSSDFGNNDNTSDALSSNGNTAFSLPSSRTYSSVLTEKENIKYHRDLRALEALEKTLQLLRTSDPESWETEERISILSCLMETVGESKELKVRCLADFRERRSKKNTNRIDDIPDEPVVPLPLDTVKVRTYTLLLRSS